MAVKIVLKAENVPSNYDFLIHGNSEEFICVRVKIQSKEQFRRLAQRISKKFRNWLGFARSFGNPQIVVLSRTYVCHHSSHGKSRNTTKDKAGKNTDCGAKLRVQKFRKLRPKLWGQGTDKITWNEDIWDVMREKFTKLKSDQYLNNQAIRRLNSCNNPVALLSFLATMGSMPFCPQAIYKNWFPFDQWSAEARAEGIKGVTESVPVLFLRRCP